MSDGLDVTFAQVPEDIEVVLQVHLPMGDKVMRAQRKISLASAPEDHRGDEVVEHMVRAAEALLRHVRATSWPGAKPELTVVQGGRAMDPEDGAA
jgi:hypothetical protein